MPFRPRRITPKPVVQGTQTAVVVGPAGEEIFTDKYGRVKVQFHWDRQGQNERRQLVLGARGHPLGGQELGDDPHPADRAGGDRRLRAGGPRPADHRRQRLQRRHDAPLRPTRRTGPRAGSRAVAPCRERPDNFNEIRFEDKKGDEQLFIHAEKNQDIEVENDETHWVGRDRTKTIDRDEKTHVKGNRTETVSKNETITIHGNRTETVNKNEKVEVKTGNRDIILDKGNDTHKIKMGNRDVQIDMGNDTLTIKLGNQTTKLNLGKSSTEAMQSIELKVGQSSIKIDQMGVTIKGMMVTVEGQIQTQVKGLMTQINGQAMLKAGGGITMIG